MILRKLTTLLDFDLDKASLAAAKRVAGDVKAGLLAASAGALALGAGLAKAIKMTADAGDLAAKTGLRLGLTTEAVQEYGYIAELSGVKAAEFAAGVARLAKKGGFDDTDQALGALADRFAAMPDGMKKTALAQEYFGRSGAQLITLLNAGSAGIAEMRAEAQALGFVISDEAARGMEAFNDDLSRLKRAGQGLVYTLGGALIPQLSVLVKQAVDWAKANNALLRQRVTEWTQKLVRGVLDLVRWARDLHARIQPIIDGLGGWESALRKLVVAVVAFKAVGLAASLIEIGVAVGKAVVALKGLGGASLVNPIVLLAIAVLGVGLALDDIQTYTKGGDSLLGSLLDGWEEDSNKLNFMRTLLAQILADLGLLSKKHRIAYGFDEPSDFVRNLGNKLRRMIDWRMMLIAPLAPALLTIQVLRSAWQTWAADVGTAISGAVKTSWTWLVAFIERSLPLIRDKAIEIGRSVSGAVTDVGTAISEAITTAWTAVVAFVERSLALIRDKAVEIGRSVSGAVTGGARSLLPTWIADRVLPNTATPGASNQTISLTAGSVTVNANTGASPAEIGRAVQQAQQDGILPMLRSALRNLAPAEE